MMIFGSVICFFIFIYMLRLFFVKKEGFEDIKKNIGLKGVDVDKICPANRVTVVQTIGNEPDTKRNVACYSDGLVNVDPIFMNEAEDMMIIAPSKSSVITLYSDVNGAGTSTKVNLEFVRGDQITGKVTGFGGKVQGASTKFRSIRVVMDVNKKNESKDDSGSCNSKPLSPAAQAAADAADAATAAAADAAATAVGVTPGVKDPYVSATPSVFSVTCPSGDPIVAFGATKPPSLDSQLGKFGGPGVKRRVYKKADFSEEDAEDEGLEGADPKNECHTADSQPADVDSSCSIKPAVPCGRNGYTFDPETEY
jgi:hypothetical protein